MIPDADPRYDLAQVFSRTGLAKLAIIGLVIAIVAGLFAWAAG